MTIKETYNFLRNLLFDKLLNQITTMRTSTFTAVFLLGVTALAAPIYNSQNIDIVEAGLAQRRNPIDDTAVNDVEAGLAQKRSTAAIEDIESGLAQRRSIAHAEDVEAGLAERRSPAMHAALAEIEADLDQRRNTAAVNEV